MNIVNNDIININTNKIKKKKYKDEPLDSNILEYYFNLPIKCKKGFIKIVAEDFSMPTYKDYNHILTINYNVSQLKLVAKYHKLKTTGNKEYLKKRLYNYLILDT